MHLNRYEYLRPEEPAEIWRALSEAQMTLHDLSDKKGIAYERAQRIIRRERPGRLEEIEILREFVRKHPQRPSSSSRSTARQDSREAVAR